MAAAPAAPAAPGTVATASAEATDSKSETVDQCLEDALSAGKAAAAADDLQVLSLSGGAAASVAMATVVTQSVLADAPIIPTLPNATDEELLKKHGEAPPLYVPGRVFHLRMSVLEPRGAVANEVSARDTWPIVLSGTMFYDHLPGNYEVFTFLRL